MGLIFSNIPELLGSDTEIALRNLSELEDRLTLIIEERLAHIDELSGAIVTDGEEIDIIKSIILSLKSESFCDSQKIIEKNHKSINSIYSALSLRERLLICEGICNTYLGGEKINYETFFEEETQKISPEAVGRIAYLKSSYNDTAYLEFSRLIPSPRAAYYDSIANVCESVYNGSCEYCILPLETSSDGKLSSFYDLILKYGFNICAVYDLHHAESTKYTRYGLVGKNFDVKGASLKTKSRIRFLEFVFEEDSYPSAVDILSASQFCSMKLRRIDTLNTSSTKSSKAPLICPIFRVDAADLDTFLTFMAIDCPSFKPLGIYTQI